MSYDEINTSTPQNTNDTCLYYESKFMLQTICNYILYMCSLSAWNTSGCNATTHQPNMSTQCQCNHLTNFGLTMFREPDAEAVVSTLRVPNVTKNI